MKLCYWENKKTERQTAIFGIVLIFNAIYYLLFNGLNKIPSIDTLEKWLTENGRNAEGDENKRKRSFLSQNDLGEKK